MVTQLAQGIVSVFVRRDIIQQERAPVYRYGAELFLASVLNGIIVFALALLTRRFLETILFVVPFVAMRAYVGGYHADSHEKCLAMLLSVQLVFYLFFFLNPTALLVLTLVNLVLSWTVNFAVRSPESKGRKLNKKEKATFRKKGTILLIAFSLMTLIFIFLKQMNNGFSISYGIFIPYLFVIYEKFRTRKVG